MLSKMIVEHTIKHQNHKFILIKLSYHDNITQPIHCDHEPNNKFENEDPRC